MYNAQRTGAQLTVVAQHRDQATLSYTIAGVKQASPTATLDASTKGPIHVLVEASDGARLELEAVDLMWSAAPVKPRTGDYRGGQKGAIVEMFGWPHKEVMLECAQLAKAGYLGVKVYPSQEQVMSGEPFNGVLNPWYFMYQPVSYRLQGRMGTRDELREMISTCRSLGVRVYADAVLNHMTGSGNDANPKHRNQAGSSCVQFGAKNSSLPAGSSPMYTQGYTYSCGENTHLPPSQEFPAVPYGPTDFHCERVLNSWTDPLDLNAGWLTGLVDLNTEKDNVRERIADYLVDLLSIGFSGFRVDAAKHMRPEDLVAIFAKLKAKLGGSLPEDFITWWEVLLGGEADLLMCNAASGYNYGAGLEAQLKTAGLSVEEVQKLKIWNSGYPKEPNKGLAGCDSPGPNATIRSVIQNDDADQQMPGSSSRDMQSQGCVLIKDCDEASHRAFEVKLFSNPNGASDNDNQYPIRVVLSSFYFQDGSMGIPDGLSDCTLCTTNCKGCQGTKYIKAYDADSKGYDKTYTRVHRDAAIVSAMQKWMKI